MLYAEGAALCVGQAGPGVRACYAVRQKVAHRRAPAIASQVPPQLHCPHFLPPTPAVMNLLLLHISRQYPRRGCLRLLHLSILTKCNSLPPNHLQS